MRCNCQNGCRLAELRCKEVISVSDGSRLGYVSDVIPWEAIRRIGDDIILTSFCADAPVQAPRAKEF